MIRATFDGPVLITAFSRPEKRNALTVAMLDNAAAAMRVCSVRAVLLTGDGDVFSSGFDLSACRENSAALTDLLHALSRLSTAIRACPRPVVASAHGAALAGACALVASCDMVVTDLNARLGYPVVKLGISPAVSAPVFASATGDGPTRARMLDSATISGEEALRIGLAHECLPTADACRNRALSLAHQLAAKPPHALAATKAWLREVDDHASPAILTAALAASTSLVGSPEERERLKRLWAKKTIE